jgi:dTMP kinase
MTTRGRFIVVEGADAVGSTTQVQQLMRRLAASGRHCLGTAEPSRGPIGVMIRELLRGPLDRSQLHRELALLFAADRLDHIRREVEPALASGIDVVSDRYVLSSLVYQSLDLSLAWVTSLNEHAPAADITVLITLPVELAQQRLRARANATATPAELFDALDVQRRVHQRYEALAAHVQAVVVDGQGSVDDVAARVWSAVST